MAIVAEESQDRSGQLLVPLAISVLIHLLLMLTFAVSSALRPKPAEEPIEVKYVDPDQSTAQAKAQPAPPPKPAEKPPAPQDSVPLPKSQIVAPPDSPEETPEKSRLLSDRDSKTLQETVKRGEPAPPAKPPEKVAKQEVTKPQAKPQQMESKARGEKTGQDKGTEMAKTEPQREAPSTKTAPVLGLSDLFVRPSELAKDPVLRKGQEGDEDKDEQGSRDIASLATRPELWADPGQRGTPDYLPDVKQGDFTLLNTKADKFAPFVRRVGLRVFQSFSMEFKQMIFSGTVPQGRDDVEVEAVMSKDGRRMNVYLKQRQGNLSSDRVLLGTLNDQIFFDQNPPAKAVAEDGLIHFVFALNARVWYGHDDSGRMQPGAHWVFGAGLL